MRLNYSINFTAARRMETWNNTTASYDDLHISVACSSSFHENTSSTISM